MFQRGVSANLTIACSNDSDDNDSPRQSRADAGCVMLSTHTAMTMTHTMRPMDTAKLSANIQASSARNLHHSSGSDRRYAYVGMV